MAKPRKPTESAAKGEATGETAERFKSLARKLVNVPREEFQVEQRRYAEDKAAKSSRQGPAASKNKKSRLPLPEKNPATDPHISDIAARNLRWVF